MSLSRKARANRTVPISAAALLLAATIIFLVAIATCIAEAPRLIVDHNLSEFGIHGATRLIFNGSLILVGTLTVLAAWCWSRSPVIASLCFIAGAAMIAAGAITVDIAKTGHAILAGVDYAGHLLLLLPLSRLARGPLRAAAYAAIATGLVCTLLWAFQAPFLFDLIGQAGTQFLAILPIALWMIAFTGRFLATRHRTHPDPVKPTAIRPA